MQWASCNILLDHRLEIINPGHAFHPSLQRKPYYLTSMVST